MSESAAIDLDDEEQEIEDNLDFSKALPDADGIPYQTLASMVLQKYVRGAFLEKDAVREVVMALR